jgi:hypothetical protein
MSPAPALPATLAAKLLDLKAAESAARKALNG